MALVAPALVICRDALASRVFQLHSAVSGVFFAVDWPNVRWIFVEVGPSYPKFIAVRVDPLPQNFG